MVGDFVADFVAKAEVFLALHERFEGGLHGVGRRDGDGFGEPTEFCIAKVSGCVNGEGGFAALATMTGDKYNQFRRGVVVGEVLGVDGFLA